MTAAFVFRATLAVLAGRALACRGPDRWTMVYIGLVWLVTFAPVYPLGNPDATRSSAVAAALVLVCSGVSIGPMLAAAALLFGTATLAAGAPPQFGAPGEIAFAIGATWPRGWSDVACTAGLFLLGSAWARHSHRELATAAS